MAKVSFRRGLDGSAARSGRGSRLQYLGLFFVAFVLLVMSRIDYAPMREARDRVGDLAAPALETISYPVVYLRRAADRFAEALETFAGLESLKEENERLRKAEARNLALERQLAALRELLKAIEEPAPTQLTARVIADARSPFLRSVLINAGRGQGVRPGFAVINAHGLVGRVVSAGESASRIILVNDLNSRIPVLVGANGVRAVMIGNSAGDPRLDFVSGERGLVTGDEVMTSGDDGILPRGLAIGAVQADGKAARVRPYARLDELDYVSVLFFDSGTLGAQATDKSDATTAQSEVKTPPARRVRTISEGMARTR